MPERPAGPLRRFFERLFGFEWLYGWMRRKPGGRNAQAAADSDNYRLEPDEHWSAEGKFPLDPRLRVVLAQLQFGNAAQILERAGINLEQPERSLHALRVFVELAVPLTSELQREFRTKLGLDIADTYVKDAKEDSSLRVFPGLIKVTVRSLGVDAEAARGSVRNIVADKRITRLELAPLAAAALGPCRNETLDDFDLPKDRKISIGGTDYAATGKGVVIGIIDDGCALAHWNFLSAANTSRLRYVWDQSRSIASHGWTSVITTGYQYGCELVNTPSIGPIDVALKNHTSAAGIIDEEGVYAELDFPHKDALAHGTHVMDIAAGNGSSLFGREGVAPKADLIFVQLPPDLVAAGGPGLLGCIADGADYVFRRAKDLEAQLGRPVPAVVNISFGNYIGPHDGSSLTEISLEQQLKFEDRAIVISAGNGFAAGCHANGKAHHRTAESLHWQLPAGDESVNSVEIWYTKAADLELYLTLPGSSSELGPVRAGDPRFGIRDPANNLIGYVDHVGPGTGNGDSQIVVTVNGTHAYPASPPPAPAGTLIIRLYKPNRGAANEFHAWIERDEARRGDTLHRRQSRFADSEADPRFTVTGIATGPSTIAVGAYDTATNEVAEYSACGPARPSTVSHLHRAKPEICAPCASDARGRGTLSAAMRFSLSTRMAGTSASAPHVAGLVALILQLNREVRGASLSVKKLRKLIEQGAKAVGRPLWPNRHQLADRNQRYKQSNAAVWNELVGDGRADAKETLTRI